jgi:hypothetical protein
MTLVAGARRHRRGRPRATLHESLAREGASEASP